MNTFLHVSRPRHVDVEIAEIESSSQADGGVHRDPIDHDEAAAFQNAWRTFRIPVYVRGFDYLPPVLLVYHPHYSVLAFLSLLRARKRTWFMTHSPPPPPACMDMYRKCIRDPHP